MHDLGEPVDRFFVKRVVSMDKHEHVVRLGPSSARARADLFQETVGIEKLALRRDEMAAGIGRRRVGPLDLTRHVLGGNGDGQRAKVQILRALGRERVGVFGAAALASRRDKDLDLVGVGGHVGDGLKDLATGARRAAGNEQRKNRDRKETQNSSECGQKPPRNFSASL